MQRERFPNLYICKNNDSHIIFYWFGGVGLEEMMSLDAFRKIDWDAVMSKEVRPPYVPEIEGESDFGHFETTFTK